MNISFGRFDNSFKTKEKTYFWRESLKLFEQNKLFDSYIMLFNYLKDDDGNNIEFSKEGRKLSFELVQGTKIIRGTITRSKIEVICTIAQYSQLAIPFMRRMMELNYTLNYCKFALQKDLLYIKFESGTSNGSPKKLFYALKEAATVSDKQDDIFLSKFSVLKPYDTAETQKIPLHEKRIKVKYFHKWIDEILSKAQKFNQDLYSGGISYLLLNLLFKIDYFISPEGSILNDLEKINYIYYGKSDKSDLEKNRLMMEEFKKLREIPEKDLYKYLYKTTSTFGILNPTKQETISELITSSVKNTQWYCENNHPDIAMTILEFAASKSLFSYGMPQFMRELFHLLIYILNQEFFFELGFKENYYDSGKKEFNKTLIQNRVKVIIEESKDQFPDLKFDTEKLDYETLFNFTESFLEEIKTLKLTR